LSYHINSIAGCQQSTKSSSTFKLIFNRDGAIKRYDFEAESPKLAGTSCRLSCDLRVDFDCTKCVCVCMLSGEIVQTLKGLKSVVDRSNSSNKSRRSRHVV
jgi:hypothetical protein